MKLDTRIMDGKKPLDCFDTEKAESYIGEECYFSDDLFPFADMSDKTNDKLIYKGILLKVSADGSDPYETDSQRFYAYCLPCEWVIESEKNKYRAYTIADFQSIFKIGYPIRYRIKGQSDTEKLLIFNGYERNNNNVYVYFGKNSYTLEQLFDDFEWQEYYTDDYKPFGVAE